jgi:protein-glucosylgalactosylhydroxylysine glucosidase
MILIRMPDFADVPCLSNGHIGFNVTDSSILLNGLYNGERGQSHRAKIPNFGNLLVLFPCSPTTCSYRLDMRRGIFEIEMRGNELNITQQILAHRYYNRAMVTIVRVEKENGREFLFNWTVEQGDNPGIDLDLIKSDKKIINGVEVQVRCYITKVLEDKNYQSIGSKVCTATPSLPSYEVKEGLNYNHYFTVGRTESEVVQELKDIMSDERSMLDKHLNVWEKHWETFGISVDDSKLNQIVHSSVFYLISNLPSEETNLPNDPFYGLSPGGLAKGGVLYRDYQGHSFWDTEMWMHPPILLMNPKWSEDILNYRFNSRQAAWENAKSTGYDGYRFPWESGFTGREVTPDCCPEVVEYQHHVVADIAFAFRSHLAATNDVEWFKNIGCDMAWNTAKFWESRVTFNDTTRFYEIRHVMGPDEDHHDIDNNVYTNVNAAINLYFGDFASCFCKDVLKEVIGDYDGFLKIAERLKLLYDEANDFHPQYENFEDGTMIKQADVVLLGFPLQLPMKE